MEAHINLISDTVTKPDKRMIDYMLKADVGDDVFKEDPTVNKLELMLCNLFGKESALYFPSGTMANQTAIKIHTQPGDQLICDHFSHIFNYEGGGVSFNSGVSCSLIEGDRGRIKAEQVEEKINPSDFYHSPRTSLVSIENTTNKGGGACYDIRELKKLGKIKNAKHVPRGMLEFWLDPESPYHRAFFKLNVFFIFYCASGWRSALSTLTAQEMGLKNVLNLDGGYTKWLECNGPFEKLI